jgi:hypothetical protein
MSHPTPTDPDVFDWLLKQPMKEPSAPAIKDRQEEAVQRRLGVAIAELLKRKG